MCVGLHAFLTRRIACSCRSSSPTRRRMTSFAARFVRQRACLLHFPSHSTLCLLRRSLTPSQPATQTLRRVRDACCRIAACAARPRRVLRRLGCNHGSYFTRWTGRPLRGRTAPASSPPTWCAPAACIGPLRALTPLLGGDRLRRSCRRPASSRRHGSCHTLGVARNTPG